MKIIQSFWTGNKNGSSVKCIDWKYNKGIYTCMVRLFKIR